MDLLVQKREKLGRGVKALRKQGLLPAELYGKGIQNLHLSIPVKDFKKIFKEAGENTIVNVEVDGKKHPVLINDVAYDSLSDEIINVDLYQVRMDEKLKVGVPLDFIGIAPAVKAKNGILIKALQEIEIEALPADLPHDLKVDVSGLVDINQSIYVKDLIVPAKVKILVNPDTVVATVTAQITEEEELAMRQAATGIESVKVESEEKKAERDAAKAATDAPATAAEPLKKEAPKK